MRISNSVAKLTIRQMGLKVRVEDGEFRVAYIGLPKDREEATCYYTDDPQDAVLTAQRMKEEGYHG